MLYKRDSRGICFKQLAVNAEPNAKLDMGFVLALVDLERNFDPAPARNRLAESKNFPNFCPETSSDGDRD